MKTAIAVALAAVLPIGLIASPSTAVAQPVPKKYQGDWVDQTGGRIKIDATTIDFGSDFKERITSIKPATESGERVLVKYGRSGVELVWYLTKVNRREILIAVNAEEPTAIFVYQRPH